MKKLLCLTICVLLGASVMVSAQNDNPGSPPAAKPQPAKPQPAGQDPFGATPAGPADDDPFGAGPAGPTDEEDPFGGGGADPFGAGGAKPVGEKKKRQEADPFDGDNTAPSDRPTRTSQTAKPSAATGSPARRNYVVVPIRESSEAQVRIETILDTPANFDYLDMPFSEVIEDISYTYQLPIVLDRGPLDDYGLDTASPVNSNLSGISVRSALRLLLREMELSYMIRDEVLVITTPEEVKARSQVALYPLSNELAGDQDNEWLVEVITSLIATDTWTTNGGSASIVYIPHLRTLAVRQTGDVLSEIGKLLSSLEEVAKSRK